MERADAELMPLLDHARIRRCYDTARTALLAARAESGHWEGELSTSALSTATAVMALEMARRREPSVVRGPWSVALRNLSAGCEHDPPPFATSQRTTDHGQRTLSQLIDRGLTWLASHQNPDGGWGDTDKSHSNISTTMLAHAVFHATGTVERFPSVADAAKQYIDRAGGVEAVRARYGKDRTFSIPILTHCALAGLIDWREVTPLPFELACFPAKLYKWLRLPVVSYALPALIAIGQARHFHRRPRVPGFAWLRDRAVGPSLRVLERIQPPNGGFLEATPLTSFVTMSLASMGLVDHPVTRQGVEFIINSVRPDGSWPIDTNLATWVTTLSINALRDDLPEEDRPALHDWLLRQQYRTLHPYTNADPGGWAWTDLPGGVPDADDTPGAILALRHLASGERQLPGTSASNEIEAATSNAVRWLLDLQNRDGGWPTFCRGWGKLPFDRSAPDLTAHCLRALFAYEGAGLDDLLDAVQGHSVEVVEDQFDPKLNFERRVEAVRRAFNYLRRHQRPDGSWLPLWFGNQDAPNDENPTYGTARVLLAYRDADHLECGSAQRGIAWLLSAQNPDGGWGGAPGTPSSVEETALTVEALLGVELGGRGWTEGTPRCSDGRGFAKPPAPATRGATSQEPLSTAVQRGLHWLMDRVEDGRIAEPSPIGFYFAKLWYFERLYPLIFTTSALKRAADLTAPAADLEPALGKPAAASR